MSLKTVHIVFIGAATLAVLYFGIWAIIRGIVDGGAFMVAFGLLGLCAGIGLVWYGVRFVRKMKAAGIY